MFDDDEKTGALPSGKQTKQKLKQLGIVSPPVKRLIKIGKGIWVDAPDWIKTEQQEKDFIQNKRIMYNIKNDF